MEVLSTCQETRPAALPIGMANNSCFLSAFIRQNEEPLRHGWGEDGGA
jgi:hypothetical protein